MAGCGLAATPNSIWTAFVPMLGHRSQTELSAYATRPVCVNYYYTQRVIHRGSFGGRRERAVQGCKARVLMPRIMLCPAHRPKGL